MGTFFVDIILPLALPQLYTYKCPENLNDEIESGKRVLVQFGKQRIYSALIFHVHQNEPKEYKAKELIDVIDVRPIVNDYQFKLWQWISEYYMCTLGEVMIAALPSALKLQSESQISLINHDAFYGTTLTSKETDVVSVLEGEEKLPISIVAKKTGIKNVIKYVRTLIDKEIIEVQEEVRKKYKPLTVSYVCLSKDLEDEKLMETTFNALEKKAPKQLELLMTYLKLSHDAGKNVNIAKKKLLKAADSNTAILNQLVKKNIFDVDEQTEYRNRGEAIETIDINLLSIDQQRALGEIKEAFTKQAVALLHGVTASGKTEIYIHLIEEQLKQNKQVLYLLPEIALTAQIINRLRIHFGNNLLVYHSRFNDNERVDVWNRMLDFGKEDADEYQVIVGARSAVFLPFSNLGLVIVDEEHDSSYKQFDPAPRYNARNTSVILANKFNGNVVLGSATPAIESYYNAKQNKYALVKLAKRFHEVQMPEIVVVDLGEGYKKGLVKNNFSKTLIDHMKGAFSRGEQVILFQNRRGFALVLECDNCHWIPQCNNCDVSLTYHKKDNRMSCHYCGYFIELPRTCVACGNKRLNMRGFGTERIEDDLSVLFPDKKIARLDLDTSRSRHAYHKLITDFENREIDILVGTQMVTKGLDFDNVSTVGILNADSLINFPNYGAHERAFQLMMQVSGRAGRKEKRGKVILQTFNPKHHIINNVIENKYLDFYSSELNERSKFRYPPFYRLIELRLKHRDEGRLDALARPLINRLKSKLGNRVFGPVTPIVPRIKNLFIRTVLIKVEKEASYKKVQALIHEALNEYREQKDNRSLLVQMDVDPM
ncbi:MAG: primosomal protein N' [Bacteroidia bacterium]|nr:primosomal protein N' [Bacteroidia bacterium]NNC86653.1 primosomal protein N' [Bacteroidia bacterium]NNM15859.1 primosomal protein N' [Bacteroidia bacterium]